MVSPYTQAHYVSGACSGGTCQNDQFPYQHDFGSILAFTEVNFNLPFIDGPPDDKYADYNAPDWGQARNHTPLSDFFGSTAYNFTNITTSEPYTCFQNFGSCTGTTYVPGGPDSGDGD